MLSQKSCSVSEVLSYFSKLKECMDVENKKEREFIEKTEFITAIRIRDLNRINYRFQSLLSWLERVMHRMNQFPKLFSSIRSSTVMADLKGLVDAIIGKKGSCREYLENVGKWERNGYN